MKRVWTSPNLVQCDLMRVVLEGEGITCVMKNENSSRFAGIGYPIEAGQALGFAWPEVWVPDEEFEQAQKIVKLVTEGGGLGGTDDAEPGSPPE